MKKVFVNGYGSIGSRISQFIAEDSEIEVIGIGKYSPDEKVNLAISRGFSVYVPESKKDSFSNYKISGTIDDAISDCDLVIDASPSGHGFMNKKKIYTSQKGLLQFIKGVKLYMEKKQFLIYYLILGQITSKLLVKNMSCKEVVMLQEWEKYYNL